MFPVSYATVQIIRHLEENGRRLDASIEIIDPVACPPVCSVGIAVWIVLDLPGVIRRLAVRYE